MKLTKCAAGHFYDADKYSACPHCNPMGAAPNTTVQSGNPNDVTVGRPPQAVNPGFTQKVEQPETKQQESAVEESGNSSLQNAVQDVQKTVGIFNTGKSGKQPVVGWLVCTEGPDFGNDYQLRMGKNFIGRAKTMDVVLSDHSVSRDKHSIIVYEPKGNLFIIQSGESRELSYLNDNVVLSPQEIKAYDTIKLGETTLLFVPLCTDKFQWEASEENNDQ